MTKIKICGLKNGAHARAAVEAGADFIGLVFAPSRRRVNVTEARDVVQAVKENDNDVVTAGVFVNEKAKNITAMADEVGLDWVQLSGGEPASLCRELDRPVLKVVHVGGDKAVTVCRRLDRMEKALKGRQHLFLLDTRTPDGYGGTGQTFDWEAARVASARFPVMVAGGLRPDNVADVLEALQPWGVDVSSGVETEGTKDVDKIREFIRKVRAYDDRA